MLPGVKTALTPSQILRALFSAEPVHTRLAAVQCDFCNDKTILILLRCPSVYSFSGSYQQHSATSADLTGCAGGGTCLHRLPEGPGTISFFILLPAGTSRPFKKSFSPPASTGRRTTWPGAIQFHFNLYLQFSKSSDMFPQAVGKQFSGFL